jgi:hypothetical protein
VVGGPARELEARALDTDQVEGAANVDRVEARMGA